MTGSAGRKAPEGGENSQTKAFALFSLCKSPSEAFAQRKVNGCRGSIHHRCSCWWDAKKGDSLSQEPLAVASFCTRHVPLPRLGTKPWQMQPGSSQADPRQKFQIRLLREAGDSGMECKPWPCARNTTSSCRLFWCKTCGHGFHIWIATANIFLKSPITMTS